MDNITPKERILKKIRAGLLYKTPNKHPEIDLEHSVYEDITDPLPEVFAKNFSLAGGKFVFCHSKYDFIDSLIDLLENKKWENLYCWDKELKADLEDIEQDFVRSTNNLESAQASLTTCECLIARTGTVVTSSLKNSRSLVAVPQAHIVVAWMNQIVPDIKDGLKTLNNRYGKKLPSAINFITGPSRTADIEMQLVTGVHGPKELYVFLINARK
ncbi:MAG: LutC/YkgG family protein [Bacteroidota bacterium]